MNRYLVGGLIVLLLLVSFGLGRISASTDAPIVTQAVLAAGSNCSAGTATGEIYLVRWTVNGIQSGICAKPDSACARQAVVEGRVPKTCRDQGE